MDQKHFDPSRYIPEVNKLHRFTFWKYNRCRFFMNFASTGILALHAILIVSQDEKKLVKLQVEVWFPNFGCYVRYYDLTDCRIAERSEKFWQIED